MYNLATATACILLEALGTVRLTVCLSSSDNIEGMAEAAGQADGIRASAPRDGYHESLLGDCGDSMKNMTSERSSYGSD